MHRRLVRIVFVGVVSGSLGRVCGGRPSFACCRSQLPRGTNQSPKECSRGKDSRVVGVLRDIARGEVILIVRLSDPETEIVFHPKCNRYLRVLCQQMADRRGFAWRRAVVDRGQGRITVLIGPLERFSLREEIVE